MKLYPTSKREWSLVAVVGPTALWIPIAVLLLVGIQGAAPRDLSAGRIILVITSVTVLLVALAVIGVRRIGLRRR